MTRHQGTIGMHLAIDLEAGLGLHDQLQRVAHALGRGRDAAAEVARREQRHLGLDAEAAHDLGSRQRGRGDLRRVGLVADIGVAEEERPLVEDQRVQGRGLAHPVVEADDVDDVPKMAGKGADGTGEQRVGVALGEHDRADHRAARADDVACRPRANAMATHQLLVEGDIVVVARIVVGIGDLEVDARGEAQPQTLDPPLDHLGPADQDGPGDALVHHHLDGAQHRLLLAVRVDQPLRMARRRLEQRLHQEP